MKMIVKTLLATSALFSLCLHAAEFTLPSYQKTVLENGLTLYLMPQTEVPLLDVRVIVKAGAADDTVGGQAALTAEALLLGTQKISKTKFEQQLEFVGANIDSGAGSEASYLSVSLASKDQDKVLPLLQQALLHPAFDQQEFDDSKGRLIAELTQKRESPKAVINDYFNQLLFGEHPYAKPLKGDLQSVNTLTLANLRSYYQQWYQPNNAAVIVTGDFEPKKMQKRLQSLFGSWKGQAATKAALPALHKPEQAKVLLVNKDDASEATFIIGGPGISRANSDFVALSVINTILGGRFTSWLNDELRVNSGLTYGARSGFRSYTQGGSFYIYTFTKTDTANAAIDLALQTYQRLWQQGIDEATLASAKAYVKGQFPPRYETPSELGDLLGDMFVYGFDENYINSFSQQVDKLDLAKTKSLINQYFPQQDLQFVIIGKAIELKDKVSQYGNVSQTEINPPQAD